MTHEPAIRTRPDGSIDTSFYMERGRMARSQQAHKLTRRAANGSSRALHGISGVALVLLAMLPFAF